MPNFPSEAVKLAGERNAIGSNDSSDPSIQDFSNRITAIVSKHKKKKRLDHLESVTSKDQRNFGKLSITLLYQSQTTSFLSTVFRLTMIHNIPDALTSNLKSIYSHLIKVWDVRWGNTVVLRIFNIIYSATKMWNWKLVKRRHSRLLSLTALHSSWVFWQTFHHRSDQSFYFLR